VSHENVEDLAVAHSTLTREYQRHNIPNPDQHTTGWELKGVKEQESAPSRLSIPDQVEISDKREK
jgi:hypothetical protein